MENDYLDNEQDLQEDGLFISNPDNEDDDDVEGDEDESLDEVDSARKKLTKEEKQEAEEFMSESEFWLREAYDDIVKASKNAKETYLQDAALTIISANIKHTSASTRGRILQDLFQKQGHNRMVNSIYTPDTPLRGADLDIDLNEADTVDTTGFNVKYTNEAREQIARFVSYLANRDLSKDSTNSRRRKEKQLPAFIIFMFSSGMYDLITNCPTMPEEYQSQITHALQQITKSKYDVVEALAVAYEEAGRPQVAEVVRKMQLAWFEREPAQIKNLKSFRDLNITQDDVILYRKFRSRFTNMSKSLTQEAISDLIEVVVDKDAGVYYKLKDKTRSEAIADVKQVMKEWFKNNAQNSEDIASGIIWKDSEKLNNN